MILIGKTANCLLGAYAHSAVLKAVDEFARMHEITRSLKVALNVLLQSFLSMTIYRIELQRLSI